MTPDWSETELATLAELAETFVRGGSLRRAGLAAEALERAADPAQVRQLRLVLRLLESRPAGLALGGRFATFRDLPPPERERLLLRWATSRLPLRRSAFQAFRKLLTFLAYADPGPPGAPNPLLAGIGYRPDRPPIASRPSAIVAFEPPPAPAPGRPTVLEADVVVVGAGAGGGVVAAELTRAGRAVLVVEAGPLVDETTLPLDELDAFSRLYLNHGLLTTWDGAVTMLSGSAVGGGTLVNWMTSIDAPADVRAEWATGHGIDGVGAGDDAEWATDRAAIETELGVTTTATIPPKDEAILRGAAALGWEAAPTRRNSTGCEDCGSCPFGCARGAKRSGLRTHLAEAAAGGARILPRTRVTRILAEGGRATGIEANLLVSEDPPTSRPIVVRAGQVVVAAGALRTPVVLARSGLDHPAIGRNLRVHPVPVVAAFHRDPIEMWRGPMQGARSLQFGAAEPGRNAYAIESAPGHPGLLALALPWEGTTGHADVMAEARHIAPLIAVTRDGGAGTVRPTRAGRVRIDYRLDPTGIATLRHALVAMARLARASGATRILAAGTPPLWHGRRGFAAGQGERAFVVFEDALRSFDFGPNRGSVFSAHQMGSARMGGAPGDAACDPRGRVRAGPRGDDPIRGLYVADGSLFPTGLGVNPMIAIMTLARRVARTVIAEGGPGGPGGSGGPGG